MRARNTRTILAGIVLMAVAVRVWRLPSQSIWFDEWLHYNLLDSRDWSTFFSQFTFIAPEQAAAPVYYALFYLSSFILGMAPTALRVVPILLGVCSVILAYGVGRRFRDSNAGLVAAMLIALSPQHIWYSQELRPYTLLVFLVLASTLVLLECGKPSWRLWLPVHCLLNGLLVFTHLFAFLVLAPQGLYLLMKRGFKHALIWGGLHCLLLVGLVFKALNIPHLSLFPSIGPPQPRIHEFLLDIVSKDVPSRYRIPTALTDSMGPLPSWLAPVSIVRPFFDALLIVMMTLVLCIFVVGLIINWARYKRLVHITQDNYNVSGVRSGTQEDCSLPVPVETSCGEDMIGQIFLLMLLFIPPLLLVGGQVLLNLPFYSIGYDLYCTVGLYVIAGVVLSRSTHFLRVLLTVLLLVLYGYQCLMLLPRTTRPAWNLAAGHIKYAVTSRDLVLDEMMIAPTSRRQPYFEDCPAPMVPVCSYRDALDTAATFLMDDGEKTEMGGRRGASVWLITELLFSGMCMPTGDNPLDLLKKGLKEYALQGDVAEFPGGTDLAVVRIRRTPGKYPKLPRPYPKSLNTQDYAGILAQSDIGLSVSADRERAIGALQRAVGMAPPLFIHAYFAQIASLITSGEHELAASYARLVSVTLPSFGPAYFGLAMAFTAEGKDQEALPCFENAFSYYVALEDAFRPFVDAVCVRKDCILTPEEWARIESFPFPIYAVTAMYILERRRETDSQVVQSALLAFPEELTGDARGIDEEFVSAITANTSEQSLPAHTGAADGVLEEFGLPACPVSWIERLFDAQRRRVGLKASMPLGRTLYKNVVKLYSRLSGDPTAFLDAQDRLLDQFPFDGDIYEEYNTTLLEIHQPKHFVAAWLERVNSNPHVAPFAAICLTEAGSAWFKKGNVKASVLAYRAACTLVEDNLVYRARLGQIYEFSGDDENAALQYRLILERLPEAHSVAERLAQLVTQNSSSYGGQ